MPAIASQFALSFELTKLPPVRAAISYSSDALISLVRALKKSGSDFLVEEDLAAIFGRGRIEPTLEESFRSVVKYTSTKPLHDNSVIFLDAGPGPTLGRALKDRYYMSSVIQLSFLGWMHEAASLATTLVNCMRLRFSLKVKGATPDPDYDGILKTLQVCSSQSSQFRWDRLLSTVEDHFPVGRTLLRQNFESSRFLSAELLLGAMDYLYLSQSLPEDRFIVMEGPTGLLPMIIWGHYILGLVVLVQSSPDGDVKFGSDNKPQLIIKWSPQPPHSLESIVAESETRGEDSLTQGSTKKVSTIYLLDATLTVLLECGPSNDLRARIEGQEFHRLKGYATTFLRRLYNERTLVSDDDPVYAETANFAVAFAISMLKSMRRTPMGTSSLPSYRRDKPDPDIPWQCYLGTSQWRLLSSSELLFWGISLDKRGILDFTESLVGYRVDDMALPTRVRTYLETFRGFLRGGERIRRENFFEEIKKLASWIITFAQVIDVDTCADLPLRIAADDSMYCPGVINWDGREPIDLPSHAFFTLVMKMLTKSTHHDLESDEIFLTCHHGWSVYYASVGDLDPGDMDCELLCVRRGVPTNTQTGERKYRIRDAPDVDQGLSIRTPYVLDNKDSYRSRCAVKVHQRTEYYSSRTDEFWLSIRFEVQDSHLINFPYNANYFIHSSYAQFHQALWGMVKTKPCPCPHSDGTDKTLPLDLGAKAGGGVIWGGGDGAFNSTRIAISLVKGNARARWLVVDNSRDGREDPESRGLIGGGTLGRRALLRCDACCEDCAVKAASGMKGNWLVVL